MTAEELIRKYSMAAHAENGLFAERHYEHTGEGRAASGMIYYYVAPDERTEFHRIDCDEYWCYVCGSPLDVWMIDEKGSLSVKRLGIEKDCEPAVYVRSGVSFASRHAAKYDEGTFISCITVPRFSYEGFRLIDRDEVTVLCPAAKDFFSDKEGD